MGQERKKQARRIKNRLMQKKFTSKYGFYNGPKKFIEEEPEVTEVNDRSEVADEQKASEQTNVDPVQEPPKQEPPKQEPPKQEPVEKEPPLPEIENFNTRLSERMNSTEITGQVRSEITDIIKAAGIKEQRDIDKFVEKSYSDLREHVKFTYNPNLVSQTKMSVDAMSFFYAAYQSLMESDLGAADQIVAAQKIASVMIKNYSPIAFAGKEFEYYGNDYVLNNREILEMQLEVLGFQDIKGMEEEVYATLRGEPIKKPEPPEQPQTNPVEPDSVDMASFTQILQPVLDDTEQYQGYNVYRKIAIKNILKGAGVNVGEESDPLGYADVLKDAYAPEKLSRETPQPMREVAKSLFISTYNALTQKGINPTDKIETTQKLTNELIAYYSPAFIDENLLKYANDYIINDNKLYRECLTALKFPEKEIKAIVDDRIDGARLHNTVNLFMSMPTLNARTNAGISDILKTAAVGETKVNALDVNEILADAYTPAKIPNASIPMRDVAKHVFMSTYEAMTKKGVSPLNKVATAQKIANLLLKNYSPVAYTKDKLDQYADNYVTNDKDLLRECLTELKVPEDKIKAIVGDKEEKEKTAKPVDPEKEKAYSAVNAAMFAKKLDTFNRMYGTKIDAKEFQSKLTAAWEKATSNDEKVAGEGIKEINNLFKDTVKQGFDAEKQLAYGEHRRPDFADVTKSTNDLMRAAMFSFTDMYQDPSRKPLFEKTALGGMKAEDLAKLTQGKSIWSMDQRSDEAWKLQSATAREIADSWLSEERPYEKLSNEMDKLVAAHKNDAIGRVDLLNRMAAAELMLINNDKMMIEDPNDPENPIPNWENRYWKKLTETREALGIEKNISIRDYIQGDYAASARSVNSENYNEFVIGSRIASPEELIKVDQMDKQRTEFTIQREKESMEITQPVTDNNIKELEQVGDKTRISVKECDPKIIDQETPKEYNFSIEKTADLNLGRTT